MTSHFSSWQIGDVKITRVIEGERAGQMFLLPDATLENIKQMDWLRPHFAAGHVVRKDDHFRFVV